MQDQRSDSAAFTRTCDVAIIGGGPAGATAACRLIELGYTVALFEREHFPRFHIGESLLPASVRLLDKLGVRDQIEMTSICKRGVELVSPDKRSTMLKFSDCWDKSMPYAFHVRRSQFDNVLLQRAKTLGADVHEGWSVNDVELGAQVAGQPVTITVTHDNPPADSQVQSEADGQPVRQQWQARFLIDASGRDTLIANKLKLKQKNPRHNSAAMYAHYTDARRLPGDAEGNISIFWFEQGWMWFIPLADGTTSVGTVCWPHYLKTRQDDLATFFDKTIAMSPELADRLAGASRVNDVTATGNYSYSSQRSYGNNYLLLGDAYAFVDPVFSSGVHLAMNSAFIGADAVHTCLTKPAAAQAALKRFHHVMKRGPREFSWFIYRITKPTFWSMLSTPKNPLRVRDAVLSLLAGDIFGKTPIWPSLYLFKGIYYAQCLANVPRTIGEWRARKLNIQPQSVDLS